MDKTILTFDHLLKIIASLSVLLIIGTYIDLKFYYGFFGINIGHYINASEILLSSLHQLGLILILLLIHLIIWLYQFDYFFNYPIEPIDKTQVRDNETAKRFISGRFLKFFVVPSIILLGIVAILAALFSEQEWLRLLKTILALNLWITSIIYIGLLMPTKLLWEKIKLLKEYNPKVITSLAIFFLAFPLVCVMNNSWLFSEIKKHGNQEKIEIILDNQQNVSQTDTIRYIGRTENYVFFWNKISSQASIYPQSSIKIIHISK